MAEAIVSFTLYGSRNLQTGRFVNVIKAGIEAEYMAQLQTLGDVWRDTIAERFASKHGRTGKTARSFRGSVSQVGGRSVFRYTVQAGGGVGFVVNPIKTHEIPRNRVKYLEHLDENFEGRASNFYIFPFKALGPVTWFQGGNESYSPDKSWYEDEQQNLEYAASLSMRKLAIYVGTAWRNAAGGPLAELTRAESRIQWQNLRAIYQG